MLASMNRLSACLITIGVFVTGSPLAAQDDPPPPVPPGTMSRDPSGRATARAVRLDEPLRLDGRLDEAVYSTVTPISDFIQTEPIEGVPATEKTDVWVFFDREYFYVTARCFESQPERMVVNEMRRDTQNVFNNENFSFMIDTFYDRRNSLVFIVTPIGGRTDGQAISGSFTRDWNPIWEFKTGRFDGGWTVEIAVPFKSLRYRPGEAQTWGFNARRINRWKNEISHLTAIPNATAGIGLWRGALEATLVGLEAPPGSKNLELKPYVISNAATDRTAVPPVSNDVDADFGLDAKYGITQNLTADFTYNTDFAQVEADEQQVNLTRFNLFFPEKREFFLENLGLFGFGGVSPSNASGNVPILSYSRRIGLSRPDNQGRVVPIRFGERLTGRVGRFSVGIIDVQTGDETVSGARATNFVTVRVKRDVLRRSSVGTMFTGRSVGQSGTGTNAAVGFDGTFAFYDDLAINTYWATTRTGGLSGDDSSYRAQLDYAGDRYGVEVARLVVGRHFNPEVGYVRRPDMRETFGLFRFSPRPRARKVVRRLLWTGAGTYIENGGGRPETRDWDGEFAIEFQNGDRFRAGYNYVYEFVPRPFRVGPGVAIPAGGYGFATMRVGYNFGVQRRVFGNALVEHGEFYGGYKTAARFTTGRVTVATQLSLEPTYSVNWVDLPERSFTSHLIGSRVTYTMTPLMFTSALVQYNSDIHAVMANVRLRWEYRPGSELFIVYNEQRDTEPVRSMLSPGLMNRAFIVKINRLFRF